MTMDIYGIHGARGNIQYIKRLFTWLQCICYLPVMQLIICIFLFKSFLTCKLFDFDLFFFSHFLQQWFIQMTMALHHIHSKKVLHRYAVQ